jgi:hypothetical protein
VWFFPTLILLMPLLSRACMVGMSSKPRPAAPSNEQICIDLYEECVALCEAGETETETDTGETDTGDETDTGETETDTGEDSECVQTCEQELDNCFKFGAPQPPASPYQPDPETPSCDPQEGYCGYDDNDNYDYGEPVGGDPASDEDYDWSCDLSGFCDSSDDYSNDDYSDDEGGGWDCSADNYDEGESDSDGDGDWGEDWGERSPAGGDGIEAPSDLPTE